MTSRRTKTGTILIVVLGILVLLALLATSFATLQSIERKVTRNYTDEVRAKLVSQSGVEMAVDRLGEIVRQGWFKDGTTWDKSWCFYGGCKNPADYYAAEALNLRPGTALLMGSLERADVLRAPLEKSARPSFPREKDNLADVSVNDPYNAITEPWQMRVEGNDIGFSGIVGGTYGKNGDLYSVKVIDCQSQINVNDGAKWGQNHSVSQNLKRMLNILGAQASVSILNLGDLILSKRPPNGYQNKFELLRVVGNDQVKFNRFKDYVTVNSWTNDYVHNPVPLSATEDVPAVYPIQYDRPFDSSGQKIYRHGHQKNRLGDGGLWGATPGIGKIDDPMRPWPLRFFNPTLDTGWPTGSGPWHAAIWAYDALNPQWIEQVSRSPVNVNTVTKEVLTALVTDLEGFFVNSRRFPAPIDIFYGFLPHRYYYDPEYTSRYYFTLADNTPINVEDAFMKQSEVGHLYRTIPYAGPGGRNSETGIGSVAVPVTRIVDEILACRERKPSPHVPGIDYSTQRFGGQFRSWAQFNEFVDFLVKTNSDVNALPLIYDNRPGYFYDYKPNYTINPVTSGGVWIGRYWTVTRDVAGTAANEGMTLVPSPVQNRIASQAAADVLKANFNPNLHLNELNPDRTLFTLVDKTDLIVNSTEFCFVPMGAFEIEAMGFVLKPPTPNADCLATPLGAGTGNEIVATKRLSTVVKMYDAEYVGLQSQLYMGDFGERQNFNPTTNNNRATESGPEPDNGPQPMECNYDGYVQLSTHGGIWEGNTLYQKPKGTLMTTSSVVGKYPGAQTSVMGTAEFGSMIHSHFQLDHVAHHHVGGADKCLPLGPTKNNNPGSVTPPRVKNFYQTSVPKTLTMAQAKANAITAAQADPFFAGCTSYTTPDAYSYMQKTFRDPLTNFSITIYTFGSATTDVGSLEASIDSYRLTNYPSYTTFVSMYCEYGIQVQALQGSLPMVDQSLNFPDVPEGLLSGPYCPPMSGLQTTAPGIANKFRLCNSFQMTPFAPSSGTVTIPPPPSKYRYAPSDLHLDGMYGELHSAIGYNLQGSRFTTYQLSCFWFKPNYFPEATSRIRTMVSYVNYYQTFMQGTYGVASLSYPLPFNLFFLPSYHSYEDPTMPVYGEPGRAVSMIYCVGADRNVLHSTSGGGVGILTPTLNHEYEPVYGGNYNSEDFDRFKGKTDNKDNHFRHHEWHHITVANAPGTGFVPTPTDQAWLKDVPDPANPRIRLFVNGRELPGTKQLAVHVDDGPNDYSIIHGDSVRLGGEYSEVGIRYANGQLVNVYDSRAAPRIYYADGTIDEFYMWRDGDFRTQAQDLFRAGRYYRANMSNANDGLFTSAGIPLKTTGRVLAPASAIASPPSTVTEVVLPNPTPTPRKRRLVAIAWTSYGEDYKDGVEPLTGLKRMEPFFRDYQNLIANGAPSVIAFSPAADANGYLYPTTASMSVIVQNGAAVRTFGTYANEAWSPIKDSHEIGAVGTVEGVPPTVDDANVIKFKAQLRVGALLPSAVLLASPVLDDVTFFYDHSVAEFQSYVEVRN